MSLATPYFWVIDPNSDPGTSSPRFVGRALPSAPSCASCARSGLWSLALLFQICRSLTFGAEPSHRQESAPAPEISSAASAKKIYSQALAHHQKEPGDAAFAWQFARACFDLAEFATTSA